MTALSLGLALSAAITREDAEAILLAHWEAGVDTDTCHLLWTEWLRLRDNETTTVRSSK